MHGNPGGGLRIESWQVAGADRRPKWAKRQRPNCLRGSEKDPLSSLLGWHILGLTYRRVSTEWLRGAHDTDGGTPVVVVGTDGTPATEARRGRRVLAEGRRSLGCPTYLTGVD